MKLSIMDNIFIQILVLAIFFISVSVSYAETDKNVTTEIPPVITIPQGELEGDTNFSRDGRKYYSFLGIPFGKSKRFQESEPADNWNGTFDATELGSSCLQYDIFENKILGTEDCLFLNIHTPKLPGVDENKTALPVMVYFHGGGFTFGSGGDYGGKYFMDEDVILVTVNYRLGAFGFVNADSGTNVGMKDQTLSLKWVKENIRHFGGDPNLVTIFGESAGGASVGLHVVSPMSKDLFQRAISHSGTALGLYVVLQDSIREFKKLGALMDCPTINRKYLTECLAKIDGSYMLRQIQDAANIPGFSKEDIPKFGVTVETKSTETANTKVFLPDTPLNLLRKGEFNHIPYILGGNSHEGLHFFIELMLKQSERDRVNEKWNEYAPETFLYEKHNCKATSDIREFYLPGHQVGSPETLQNISDATTDRYILHTTKTSAEFHSKFAKTYLYYFSLRGPDTLDPRWNSLNISSDGLAPAGHADELQYLFQTESLYKEILPGSPFEKFSDWFVKLWVSFARTGNTPEIWNPVNSSDSSMTDGKIENKNAEWFQIDKDSKMVTESDLLGNRMNFWNTLFPFKST